MNTAKTTKGFLTVLTAAASLNASAASAAPVVFGVTPGIGVMGNANDMSVIGSTILAPQQTELTNRESAKEAAASAAQDAPAAQLEQDLLSDQVTQIATQIQDAGQGSNPPAGTFTFANGQSGSYNYNSGTGATSVTIGGTTFTIQ